MSRVIWTDGIGREHFVDELTDTMLTREYDFASRVVDKLKAELFSTWELAEFMDGTQVESVAFDDIGAMDEDLINALSRRNVLAKEKQRRNL